MQTTKRALSLLVSALVYGALLTPTAAALGTQQTSPPQTDPGLLPVDLTVSGDLVLGDGSAYDGWAYVKASQVHNGVLTQLLEWVPTMATSGAFSVTFEDVPIDGSARVDILVAPVGSSGHVFKRALAYATPEAGRHWFRSPFPQVVAGGGLQITCGTVALMDAPNIGDLTLTSSGASANVIVYAGQDYTSIYGSNSPITLEANTPTPVYSWLDTRVWSVQGDASDGGVIVHSNFVRGVGGSLLISYPVDFSVQVDSQLHADPFAVILFDADSYEALAFDSSTPDAIKELTVALRISDAGAWMRPLAASGTGVYQGVLPGNYILEFWCESDMEVGAPSVVLPIAATDGAVYTL